MASRRKAGARQRGFALITVLWMLAVASIILLRSVLTGRDAFAGSRNRILLARASWRAEGCAAIAHSVMDNILGHASDHSSVSARWVTLDRRLGRGIDSLRGTMGSLDACEFEIDAAGARVDLNLATRSQLLRVILEETGDDRPDLADAIVDWRDADDLPGVAGTENDWYLARARALPRNAPFADLRELALVRGFEDTATFRRISQRVGVEQGVIALNNAPMSALLTVPGISREAATFLVDAHDRGRPIADLQDLSGYLSPSAADTLLSQFPDAVRLSVLEPPAWVLQVVASVGSPAVKESIQLRFVRSGDHVAIVRRRNAP